ncbi:hypothetical protein ACIB24_08490 [Spongisporangium articulatum]|uniref:Uncharacterized protein n=1 Tax=Spongisporangium articulatum TaxID=3362603 RepID=A0ABW8AL70_9ACTN
MGDGFDADTAALLQIGQELVDSAAQLGSAVPVLAVTPDAGASSNEVAGAFRALAAALDGVAEKLLSMGNDTGTSADTYQKAEDANDGTVNSIEVGP